MGIASPINREWLETTRNSPVQKSKIRTKIRALKRLRFLVQKSGAE
jgi:hypothetical protein